MDEPTTCQKRDAKVNLVFRILEIVFCASCLITCVVLFLYDIKIYLIAPALVLAALTTAVVIASLCFMLLKPNERERHQKIWMYVAIVAMICHLVCSALFVLQLNHLFEILILLAMSFSIAAAVVFFLDVFYNLSCLMYHKHKARNRIQPENSAAERAPCNEACGMIECSVIVGDQLACNQQLCHVKWSGNQASTPTPKLIFVQPCNSTVVQNVCPACKNINCEKCFKTEIKEEKSAEKITQTDFKSTQFPEDTEKICPLCSFKAVKVSKTASVQTSPSWQKRISEEMIIRDSRQIRFKDTENLCQSSPVTPRKSELMVCPKCLKKSTWLSKLEKTHLCPMCNQQCKSKTTCTSCYDSSLHPEAEPKKRASLKASKEKRPSRSLWKNRPRFGSKKFKSQDEDESERSSPEPPSHKMVQVSSKDFMDEKSPKKHRCCSCIKRGESSKEILDDTRPSTEHLYENKTFGDRSSTEAFPRCFQAATNKEDKWMQVSQSDFPENATGRQNKQTQVSLAMFSEEEKSSVSKYDKRACGAPNCQHPKCSKHNQRDGQSHEQGEKMPDPVQTDVPQVNEKTRTIEDASCQTSESLEEVKGTCCQTGKSLEEVTNAQTPTSPKEEREEIARCTDPNCHCVVTEEEIFVCAYCQSLRDKTMETPSGEAKRAKGAEKAEGASQPKCKCNMPTCICCKAPRETYETQTNFEVALPVCSSFVGTCPYNKPREPEWDDKKRRRIFVTSRDHSTATSARSSHHARSARSSRNSSREEEQKHNSEKSAKDTIQEKEARDDDSYCYETPLTENETEKEALSSETQAYYKKEYEEMSVYLNNKMGILVSAPATKTKTNVAETADLNDELKKKIHVEDVRAYQATTRKENDPCDSKRMLEKTYNEMQKIYNTMIKNLLERNSKKEQDIILLEKMKCGCNADYVCSKHQECLARKEEEFRQKFQFQQLIDYTKPVAKTPGEEENNTDDADFNIKDRNLAVSSSDLIISESLSTITEEISAAPSDSISISRYSEATISKELLEEDKQEKTKVIGKRCSNYRIPDLFFTAPPCKTNQEKKIVQSERGANVSPQPSISAGSERGPRKSAGFFEPFLFSPMHGSTKTSITTSDNDSTIELNQQEIAKTVSFSASSCASFNLEETPLPNSVPISSRSKTPAIAIDPDPKTVLYCEHSIPCTPKKIRWNDLKSDYLTDTSEASSKKPGTETFRKDSDYDIGTTTEITNFYENTVVPPLPIENITPEYSETEESRPISCSSHFSARTLQTIENINLELCAALLNQPKYIKLQERKHSKKTGMRSQPQSTRTRTHSILSAEKPKRKHKMKLSPELTNRERRISSPLNTSQQRSKPKKVKSKSAISQRRKIMKLRSAPAAIVQQDEDCNCDLYKSLWANYCKEQCTGPQPKVAKKADGSSAKSSKKSSPKEQ